MSTPNGTQIVPTWQPGHQRMDGQDHTKTGSFRVNPRDASSQEFRDYLKQCGDLDIVVEGDSWFDLWRLRPGYDCLMDVLKDLNGSGYFKHRFVSFAHYGDTLDNITYGKIDQSGYQRPGLDEVIAAAKQINAKALLFSAGGNDIVGPEFKMLINHSKTGPGRPALRKEVVDYIIHGYIKDLYLECGKRLWKELPDAKMFIHGYANSWPSGIGYSLFGITVAGPWLLPSLLEKAYPYADRRPIVIDLMTEFNKMLSTLPTINKNFVYVDFRKAVGENMADWEDELHLSSPALKIAGKYLADAVIGAIGN
ncbi:MAG: hypothetical protein QM703_18660 [Gemmatales bacterium]